MPAHRLGHPSGRGGPRRPRRRPSPHGRTGGHPRRTTRHVTRRVLRGVTRRAVRGTVRRAVPRRGSRSRRAAAHGTGRRDRRCVPRTGPAGPPRCRPAAGSGNGLPLGDVRQECRGLARAAVRLDAAAVEHLLASAVGQHGLVTAWEEVMVPTLRAAGRKWETAGDRYVEVEHLLSWHISSALRRVPSAPPGPPGVPGAPPVLLACVPDEQHALPLEALAAALAEQGFPVRMFGAALPVEALDAAVRRTGPAAVVLWSQSRSTANRPLARHVAASEWG